MSKKIKEIKAPHNPIARRVYYETYGKLLAEHKMWEVKASNFGKLFAQDRGSTTVRLPSRTGYTTINRYQICKRSMGLYETDELVRAIINLIASAIFSTGQPDIRGENEELVEAAQEILEKNDINFHDLAREGELCGDVFLYYTKEGDNIKICSLDSSVMDSVLEKDDVRKVTGYQINYDKADTVSSVIGNLSDGSKKKIDIPLDKCQHLKFNSTTTSQYGRSGLRHLIYWLDVKDKLFEENWLRGAQYYGNPLLAITGVPGPYQQTVKNQIEAENQRAGKSWVLPPDTDIKVPDLSLSYPIGDIVGWVFRMISIGSEVPITLLGSADAASRGSAFYANPRFVLAINPKREVWRIGLRRFLIKVLTASGKIKEGESVSTKDFDIGFQPMFEKDLANVADVVTAYHQAGLISDQSAMELIGLDSSKEAELIQRDNERKASDPTHPDSIDNPNNPNNPENPNSPANIAKTLADKRAGKKKYSKTVTDD